MRIALMDEYAFNASKRLWLSCFEEDDAAFVDWYYSARTRPEYALGAFFDGKSEPAAMLHMLPMRMRFEGKAQPVCFVAGVCTAPEYRNRGVCTALFDEAFAIMKNRGFAATALQPFSTAFYERFGYKTFSFRDKYTLSDDWTNIVGRTDESRFTHKPSPGLLLGLYNAFTADYSGCSVRAEDYFRGFTEEYSLPGAYLAASASACCAGYFDGDGFTATELFFLPGALGSALALLPERAASVTFALPVGMGCLRGAETKKPGVSVVRSEPFCMIAPLSPQFDKGGGECFCLDRY